MDGKPATPLEFLEDARPLPGENRFILGTFERGVTFYRQQIRALNLVYSIIEAKDACGKAKVLPCSRVIVIGGGAFGVTAAAAAAYAGFKVVLVERQQILHLQRGCDTRWLHPRFYDWPAPESESRLARLPILDWASGTAAQVAEELEREIQELTAAAKGTLRCIEHVNKFDLGRLSDGSFEIKLSAGGEQDIIPADVVIYAVGLGIETAKNEPYWRNDRLGQTELDYTGSERVRYVVSGIGDGGLIDVFRLTIADFRHERIFSEMFGTVDRPALVAFERLRSNATANEEWLYDQFVNLEGGPYGEIISGAKEVLSRRLRSDTSVTLNAPDGSLRRGLTLDRVSLSNALLAFCLYRVGAFQYEAGRLDLNNPHEPKLLGSADVPVWLKDAKLIVRHGTDRRRALRDAGCSEEVITFVERQKDLRDSGKAIYPAGWWGRYTAPSDAVNPGRPPAPVEFVPPALMTHSTTFVATLGNILASRLPERRFRVTLHRLVRFDGQEFYQQITPYGGNVESKVGLGRCFRAEAGLCGLAARSGSLVIARKTNDADFGKIWELVPLDRGGAKQIQPYVQSLVACPFFAPKIGSADDHVSLILFADSAEATFFSEEVLSAISAACRGFVNLLEDLNSRRAIRSIPTYYPGIKVDLTAELQGVITELRNLGVQLTDTTDRGWRQDLTFRTLNSLELEVGPSMNLGA